MKILGIETSCDETGASAVQDGTIILSNIVASSQEIHIKTGGIIPEVAAREQIKCIIPVIDESIKSVKGIKGYKEIDAIAATVGPGLIGSLLVGVETAKTLAYLWHKPIVPVNHLLAHIYANWLSPNPYPLTPSPSFPLIALIVSGGHTELILMKDHGKYQWLGGTRDDAAGEAFDKIARLLGLGYPGGPAIASAAANYILNPIPYTLTLPRPMVDSGDFDFSFSGLKTAVLRIAKEKGIANFSSRQYRMNSATPLVTALAYEVQEAITDVLVEKTIRATREKKVKSILIAGGVAANSRLREKFQSVITNSQFPTSIFTPLPSLCTDNAAIVASCAYFNYHPVPWQKIKAEPSLELK